MRSPASSAAAAAILAVLAAAAPQTQGLRSGPAAAAGPWGTMGSWGWASRSVDAPPPPPPPPPAGAALPGVWYGPRLGRRSTLAAYAPLDPFATLDALDAYSALDADADASTVAEAAQRLADAALRLTPGRGAAWKRQTNFTPRLGRDSGEDAEAAAPPFAPRLGRSAPASAATAPRERQVQPFAPRLGRSAPAPATPAPAAGASAGHATADRRMA